MGRMSQPRIWTYANNKGFEVHGTWFKHTPKRNGKSMGIWKNSHDSQVHSHFGVKTPWTFSTKVWGTKLIWIQWFLDYWKLYLNENYNFYFFHCRIIFNNPWKINTKKLFPLKSCVIHIITIKKTSKCVKVCVKYCPLSPLNIP